MMPKTNEAIANPLVFGCVPGGGGTGMRGWGSCIVGRRDHTAGLGHRATVPVVRDYSMRRRRIASATAAVRSVAPSFW